MKYRRGDVEFDAELDRDNGMILVGVSMGDSDDSPVTTEHGSLNFTSLREWEDFKEALTLTEVLDAEVRR